MACVLGPHRLIDYSSDNQTLPGAAPTLALTFALILHLQGVTRESIRDQDEVA
jgi:hypothetical protein